MTAYHDTNAEASTRPIKYESQEKAWGSKGGLPSVWGQKSKYFFCCFLHLLLLFLLVSL